MAPQQRRHMAAALFCVVLAAHAAAQPLEVVSLLPSGFEHATQAASGQTTGAWAVLLFNSSDEVAAHATGAASEAWDSLAAEPGKYYIMAKVDVAASGGAALVRRFGSATLPAVLLLRDRHMWSRLLPAIDDDEGAAGVADAMRSWLGDVYLATPGSTVPPEAGIQEFIREMTIKFVREATDLTVEPNMMLYTGIVLMGVGALGFLTFIVVGLWVLFVPERPSAAARAAGGQPTRADAVTEGGDESDEQQATGALRGTTRATTRRRA